MFVLHFHADAEAQFLKKLKRDTNPASGQSEIIGSWRHWKKLCVSKPKDCISAFKPSSNLSFVKINANR